MTLGPKVVRLLEEQDITEMKVIMGGVMAPSDAKELEENHGIYKVFLPDTPMETIVDSIHECMGMN